MILAIFGLISGLGGNFSAGYDLSELAKIEKDDIANELVRNSSNIRDTTMHKLQYI